MYSYDRTARLHNDTYEDVVGIVEAVDLAQDGQDALREMVTKKLPKLIAMVRKSLETSSPDKQEVLKAIDDFRSVAVRAHDGLNGLGEKYDNLERKISQAGMALDGGSPAWGL